MAGAKYPMKLRYSRQEKYEDWIYLEQNDHTLLIFFSQSNNIHKCCQDISQENFSNLQNIHKMLG